MEYEKLIKRLVLGYLKAECKNAYKIFKKTNFQNQHKITTRVAGQSLEDILRTYSRIQDIVNSHLEDTDYYKENPAGATSPVYLPEQILYLLNRDRPLTPVSTIYDRSYATSPVSKEIPPDEEMFVHYSDVETTPEHTLPGNMFSLDDELNSKTPFRRKGSPIFRTPYLENLSNSEHENISSVLSTELLKKPEFHKKLARNINSARNTPALSCSTRKDDHEVDKIVKAGELEGTIKGALTITQADPIFEDLLQEFLDPIANTISKAIEAGSTSPSSSSCTSPSRNMMTSIDDHNNGAVSSILAVSNGTNQSNPNNNDRLINVIQNEIVNKPAAVVTSEKTSSVVEHSDQHSSIVSEPTSDNVASSEQVGPVPQNCASTIEAQPVINTPSSIYTVPSSSKGRKASQQQQFYIVNQPLLIPQPMQLVQPVPSVGKPIVIDTSKKVSPTTTANLTEQDIMSMPTIILNERNEITYADPVSLTMTPYKPNEVNNIKEYLNVFNVTDQSPIIKKQSKKQSKTIKPTPTIKVEIFNRDEPLKNVETVQAEPNADDVMKELPNVCDTVKEVFSDGNSKGNVNEKASKSTSNDNNMNSNDKTKSKSLNSACTPSPLVITTVRKPTPKSGSHVRNLTFPSPIRKTSEKPDGNRNSPSALNKQQASKDLFKEKVEESQISTENKKSSKEKSRTEKSAEGAKESEHATVPKKRTSPRKTTTVEKETSPKKNAKKTENKTTKKGSTKTFEHKTPKSWDAALRKNVSTETNETQLTPVRRTSVRKRVRRSTELDGSDPEGKKLEEALKTPGKIKGKIPSTKKPVRTDKTKPEKKLAKVDEVCNVETKKVLSPSKLCNTASKRNMEVDGITPNAPKETNHQLVSNARKNITSLLETPLKEDGLPSSSIIPDPTNTPFTPMLKANLKDFTVGDTFSIDTPNFPVTPGLSLMNNSPASYCILNDTETNKATEAIILSEERKSSVRKTDDEELDMSPKVYGCKEILDEFNKSRAGKKNLELLDNRGVNWEGSSDKEYNSDISESNSDETNNTVIQKTNHHQGSHTLTRSPRIAGKSMNVLKSRMLDKNEDPTDAFDICEEIPAQKLKTPEDHKNEPNKRKINNLKAAKTEGATTSSSDSEIVKKDTYKNKLIHVSENSSKKEVASKNTKNKEHHIADEKKKNESTNKKHIPVKDVKSKTKDDKDKIEKSKEHSVSMPDIVESTSVKENTIDNISSVTTETIKQTVLAATLEEPSSTGTGYSLQTEIEEKRKRVIELVKAKSSEPAKTPSRRRTLKCQPNLNSPNNRRKRAVPNKLQSVPEEQSETSNDRGKVDSQDEFFKKSGSNLHRTNKHSGARDVSEKVLDLKTKETVHESKTESLPKAQKNNSCEIKADKVTEHLAIQSRTEAQKTSEVNDQRQGADMDDDSFSNCIMELQPEAIAYVHDESNPSKKRLEDYNFNMKEFKMYVPLTDGSLHAVKTVVTPFKILWEIKPSTCYDNVDSSDSENGGSRTGYVDEGKCSKKRKQRSDSCNSDSSAKKMKTSLIPDGFNIEKLLTKLHGPSDKT